MPAEGRAGGSRRKESKEAQKAAEKERKRLKGDISCAECRRLKLKCDKKIPCESCARRGCQTICPNGVLVTGGGTRFVLADTPKLHAKIDKMSERIRLLEVALEAAHHKTAHESHPLLADELRDIKSTVELHGADPAKEEESYSPPRASTSVLDEQVGPSHDPPGTLRVRSDGALTFYGRSAGSESLLMVHFVEPDSTTGWSMPAIDEQSDLPPDDFSTSFPFPCPPAAERYTVEDLVKKYLPPCDTARAMCETFIQQAPWYCGAVRERQIREEILPTWYPAVGGACALTPAVSRAGSSDIDLSAERGAHELALLFIVLCFGCFTDTALQALPENADAERYYRLACAALTLEPMLHRPPSVSTVQTLLLMSIYQDLNAGEHNNSMEPMWTLISLAGKFAQSIGLHRDPVGWKLAPFEVQKRRSLFWELYITDCWMALATGRVATFALAVVDCEQALDTDEGMTAEGAIVSSFPAWKGRFGAECLSHVVQHTLAARAPKYHVTLDIDRKIRDFAVPEASLQPQGAANGLAQAMSQFMPKFYKLIALIYVHRTTFASAINESPNDPTKSAFQPSFTAGYHSACDLLILLHQQFHIFPVHIARMWNLWIHAFSSAVMLSAIVTRASGEGLKSKFSGMALTQVRNACELFEDAATYGGRAGRFVPILNRILHNAHQTINGTLQVPRNDIFTPTSGENTKDELSIFSGEAHTITQARRPSIQISQSPGSLQTQVQEDPNAYSAMHPVLANEVNEFQGHLSAHIPPVHDEDPRIFDPYPSVASTGYQQLYHHHSPAPHLEASHLNPLHLPAGVASTSHHIPSSSHHLHGMRPSLSQSSYQSQQSPTYESPQQPYDPYQYDMPYQFPPQQPPWSAEQQPPQSLQYAGPQPVQHGQNLRHAMPLHSSHQDHNLRESHFIPPHPPPPQHHHTQPPAQHNGHNTWAPYNRHYP